MIIPTSKNTKTVTDLRENSIALLEQIKKSGPTFIFQHSKPKAVMLSIEEYSNMMEMLEDYFDAIKAKELEEEGEFGGISLDSMIKKYNLNV
jgi:prevent-host-death family protein